MIFSQKNKFGSVGIKRNIIFFFILIGLFFCNDTYAQRGGGGGGSFPSSQSGRPGGSSNQKKFRKVPKDSLLVFYYFMDNPNQEFENGDTLLTGKFHQFDPAKNQLLDYGTLGYLGSPVFPLFYQTKKRQGFDVGLHQYDLYKIHAEDLRFYNLKRAYSDFYFSQGSSQDDIQLKAKFSRNFANNINASIDYHRISQFGSRDPIAYFYQNQRARHTALAGGLAYHNDAKTYRGFFAFSNNIHQQEDNGGIQSDTFFMNQDAAFSSALAIPVGLDGAETRHSEQKISYTQYYIFNPKQWKANKKRKAEEKAQAAAEAALRDSIQNTTNDSLKIQSDSTIISSADTITVEKTNTPKSSKIDTTQISKIDSLKNTPRDSTQKTSTRPNTTPTGRPETPTLPPTPTLSAEQEGRSYIFAHKLLYAKGTYKFSDVTPVADSAYWKNLLLDTRGLRHFYTFRKIENQFSVSTFKPRKNDASKAQTQSDFFEVGIRHAFHWIDEEAADSTVNNLFLTGKWNFTPSERLKVKTNAHLGLWDNAGDYRIQGELFFDLKKIGQLQLNATNQLYSPSALQQRFYISQRSAWQNDFRATLETNLSAAYALPKLGFKATAQYHLLNNFIYFDTLATAQQVGTPVSIFQLILEQNFKFGKFHLDNAIVFQQNTNDAISLPNFFSKHSFYYQGKWFKRALEIRLGTDVRMNNSYFANTYNPLVGQFILQNNQKIGFFPTVDLYASIKVKTLRFFVKSENMTRLFTDLVGNIRPDEQYYNAALYPIQNNRFRLGLSWTLGN